MGFLLLTLFVGYLNIPSVVLKLASNFLPQKYKVYVDSLTGSFSSAGGIVSLCMLLLFFFQCFLSARNKKDFAADPAIRLLEEGQFYYLIVLFTFVHAGVASCLSFTFLPFFATIPITFARRIVKRDKGLAYSAIAGLMVVMYVVSLKAVSNYFIPYHFTFDLI